MKRIILGTALVIFLILFNIYSSHLETNKIHSTSEVDTAHNQNKYINVKIEENKIAATTETENNLLKSKLKLPPAEDKEEQNTTNKSEATPLIEKIRIHQVKQGETLSTIAVKYNIDINTILGANHITNMNRIKPGMTLKILPTKGILYKLGPGESLWEIAHRFDIKLRNIITANGIEEPELVQIGRVLILPNAKPEFDYQSRLKQRFIEPVKARISSPFGWRWGKKHEGIDYAVNSGTNIKAARGGRVIYSGWAKGYGKTIIIQHQQGVKSLYAHNSRLLVHSGKRVYRGQVITKSGNTGRSTGPHLHFEIRINGKPVNPQNYLIN